MRAQEPFGRLQGRRGEEERYTLRTSGKAERRFPTYAITAPLTVHAAVCETVGWTWPPSGNGLHVTAVGPRAADDPRRGR